MGSGINSYGTRTIRGHDGLFKFSRLRSERDEGPVAKTGQGFVFMEACRINAGRDLNGAINLARFHRQIVPTTFAAALRGASRPPGGLGQSGPIGPG